MKIFQLLTLLLFMSLTGYSQIVSCSLQGPGSADGGTDPVDCGQRVNYSFQDTDGSVCTPPGNTANNWSWCIDNLGSPGFISINQNTNFPVFFTMSNGVQGEIVGASAISITIDWNCNGCTGDVSHINIFFGCNNEIYQSSVFVNCAADCTYNSWDCVSTDCDCIKVCINGVVQTLNNSTGNELFFCYPEGTVIGNMGTCDENILCSRPGKPNTPRTDDRTSSDFTAQEDAPNHIEIPDVKIMQTSRGEGEASLSITLPDSKQTFELLVSDNLGRVVHSKKLVNQYEAKVQLDNLQTGIYHILITDGNYRITQKVFVN